MSKRSIMIDWLKPSKHRTDEYDPLDDPPAYAQARQRPQPRFDPPENPREFSPQQRRRIDESQLPPDIRRVHHDGHQHLTERFQEQREEYREQYAPQPRRGEYEDEYAPQPRRKKSRLPIILVAVNVSLFLVGLIIAVINIIYVKNPGQTIQSLTMIHAEIVVVLLTVLINTILTEMKRGGA